MTDRMKRAMARNVLVAALAPVLTLSACSSPSYDPLASRLGELDHVVGSYIWDSTSGLPTNRSLSVRLYVDGDLAEDDLGALLDSAFREAWEGSPFEPVAGIAVQVAVGERPQEPSAAPVDGMLDLRSAMGGIDWSTKQGTSSGGTTAIAGADALADRYGAWGS